MLKSARTSLRKPVEARGVYGLHTPEQTTRTSTAKTTLHGTLERTRRALLDPARSDIPSDFAVPLTYEICGVCELPPNPYTQGEPGPSPGPAYPPSRFTAGARRSELCPPPCLRPWLVQPTSPGTAAPCIARRTMPVLWRSVRAVTVSLSSSRLP